MLEEVGFVDIEISKPVDTFAGAGGEAQAKSFRVLGYSFLARKPETNNPNNKQHNKGKQNNGNR